MANSILAALCVCVIVLLPATAGAEGEATGRPDANGGSGNPSVPTEQDDSPLVLFDVKHANNYAGDGVQYGWFAIPVACVDASGGFVQAPASCVESMHQPPGLHVVETNEAIVPTAAMSDVYDSYSRGLPLPEAANVGLLYSVDRQVAPPRPVCTHQTTVDVPPLPLLALERVAEVPATLQAAAALGEPWVASQAIAGDFDGDGQGDRFLSHRFESNADGTPNCDVVIALWGNGDQMPSLLEFACDDADHWTLTGRQGPFNLADSPCWDLNRDGRIELWLSTGFDSERGFEFVEVRDGQLVRAGETVWFGD